MIRRDSLRRPFICMAHAPICVAGICLFACLGCIPEQLIRGKSEEETERERYGNLKTIRDVCIVGNADAIPVGGVGYVTGLDGTGGDSPADSYRTVLEDQLRKAGVPNPKNLLASPENAMVIVTGLIPPGTHEGEPFDVEVTLPRGSKATSLRGGALAKCRLFTYAQAGNLRQDLNGNGSGELVLGHAVASAEGPLLVGMGFGKDEDEARLKKARIWNGGRTKITASLRLLLNPDKQHASLAGLIANRLNETFHGAFPAGSPMQIAVAHDNLGIDLNVPPKYRLNLPHFLRVVLAVPLHLPSDAPGADGATAYRQRLADDLLDPARTVTAALRLEALADDRSVAALKAGLKSQDVKVRFCSAESLAYLGNSAGGEELSTIVKQQPYLRAFALTALASLDQKVSYAKLHDILATSNNDVVRYGAFRALRTLNDKDEAIAGELLNESFWLHRIAPKTEPMIHVSSSKRPEIVLFGEEAKLEGPFALRAGQYCVTATDNDQDHCMVSWVPPAGGSPERRECPLQVEPVLRTLAAMGVTYPEAIEILQQADQSKCLNCRVRADALPQLISVEELAEAGKKKADGTTADVEILQTNEDIGATPGLFDNQRPRWANPFGGASSLQQEAKPNRVIGGD
jgi:hypothetical protein